MTRAPRARVARPAVLLASALLAACGVQGHTSSGLGHTAVSAARVVDGDWPTFDYNAARSGVGPASTGITAENVSRLRTRTLTLNGVADSSAVQLHAIKLHGQLHDVDFVTTTYGRTVAFDPATAKRLWEYTPADIGHYQGSAQITTASPVLDPDHRYLYAASPDGFIHKLSATTGHQLWSARVTWNPKREKIEGALNISGRYVIVATGGYIGDAPVYQGHLALIDRSSGHVAHVWNALCSNRHQLLHPPTSCPASDAAIWGRAGAVVEPGSGRLLAATGNGSFNGATNWGDSVLELSSDASRLLHNWTPKDQAKLSAGDQDVGSTAPVLLPGTSLAVQAGKAGVLDLLDLKRLDGTTAGPGPRTGGQLQTLPAPASQPVYTAPVAFRERGSTFVVVADYQAIAGYKLSGDRLHQIWLRQVGGSSPVIAGGLMFVYDPFGGWLRVMAPTTGRILASLAAARGHWSSPIVEGGRVVLPVGGSVSDRGSSGKVLIYHLPGR